MTSTPEVESDAEEARIAEAVQGSLVAQGFEDLPGLSFGARYRPGPGGAHVGGDWYDVIPLPDGQAAFVVGDVAGHGLRAATGMARLQSAARAYGLEGLAPPAVLERMNAFARDAAGRPVATMLYALLNPDDGILRIASAGHPPMLWIGPDDEPRFAECSPGSPLGGAPMAAYNEALIGVPAGSTLLLYTDGLVGAPLTSLAAGLDWLRQTASQLGNEPEALCTGLLDACLRDRLPRDDVAVLAIALDPIGEGLELTFPAEPASLARMRRSLGRWLRESGASEGETYEIVVASGEACANAIAHAYPPGEGSYVLEAHREGRQIELLVRDFGAWRPTRRDSRGRGLLLIEQLMDDVRIDRGAAGTCVSMRRVLRPDKG